MTDPENDAALSILHNLVDLDDRFANAANPYDMPLADEWTAEIEKARALLTQADDR